MPKSAKDFIDIELVQKQLEMAADAHGQSAASRFFKHTSGCLRHLRSLQFDSPLEVTFWIWWHAVEASYAWLTPTVTLQHQHEIDVNGERFRLDFFVDIEPELASQLRRAGLSWPLIAVEVDGHEFHERTREQVACRDRRDRALQQAQWKVFHFSYAEFTNRPEACVREVWEFVANIYHDLHYTMNHTT